jgi:putative Mg2+ transporter-C (MgtC) family protein
MNIDAPALTSFASFWDSPDVHINILIFFNLVTALILGLIVGYERTYRGRAAGMRTYGLVCMASAALTIISGYTPFWFGGHPMNLGPIDPTRTIQGIVTGIGFLGAGIIMKDGRTISGLTTAASIWACAAIGVMIGVGFYLAGILFTALSVLFMMWGIRFESLLPSRPALSVMLRFKKSFVPLEEVISRITTDHGYEIAQGTLSISSQDERTEWRFIAVSFGRTTGMPLVTFSRALAALEGVESFQLCHARN